MKVWSSGSSSRILKLYKRDCIILQIQAKWQNEIMKFRRQWFSKTCLWSYYINLALSYRWAEIQEYRFLPPQLFYFNFIFFYFQREGEKKREGENHWCERETSIGCLSHSPNKDRTWDPCICPDWESNWRPFTSLQADQPTEPLVRAPLYHFFNWGNIS